MGKYDYLRGGRWVATQRGTRVLKAKEASGFALAGCLNVVVIVSIIALIFVLFGGTVTLPIP